jgi:hypothetical protein
LAALLALAACASSDEAARVSVQPTLVFPKGLLDGVTKLTMLVYDASASVACDATTGRVTLTGKVDPILTKDLDKCPAGSRGKFCGQLQIAKSDRDRVFSAVARAGTNEIADGCAVAKVNQDELPLEIKMVRYVPPATCGNDVVEATEQCDPPGDASDPVCDTECHTKEIVLSTGGNGTVTGNPGDKANPFLLWPAGSGNAGRLIAFFSDKAASSPEITMRVMSDTLGVISTPQAFRTSLFVPRDPVEFPPQPTTGDQSAPAAAFAGNKYFVVFQDNNSPGSNGLDVHLRSMDSALAGEQSTAMPYVGINGPAGGGEPNIQEAPSVAAGSANLLFIAWHDRAAARVFGRTYDTQSGALGTQQTVGNRGTNIKVAGRPSGWVAVWSDGANVRLRLIGADGVPAGQEETVNEGGSAGAPSVASLPDGRFAIAFANGGDVFVQRYTANATKVAGDQAAPVNDLVKDGDQSAPAIASMSAAGGSYVVAWSDASSGHVRARLLGGSSGFLFNNVDGQPTEFQASLAEGRVRANPAVAVGGAGPFIAIGWEDKSPNPGSGIVVRRFPLPQ